MKLSIIISNYNYARFLGEAIDSALQVEGEKEVIVVDDGSTDTSRRVIEGYGDKVVAIFRPNSGQNSALNAGFKVSTGNVVIFLDADDMLNSDIYSVLTALPPFAKAQWSMTYIAHDGSTRNANNPHFPKGYGTDTIRGELQRSGSYTYSPTSGNAWSREFLERVMPLPEQGFVCTDGYLSLCAPYFGEVISIDPPSHGRYRVHGANYSMYAQETTLLASIKKAHEDTIRLRQRSAERLARDGITLRLHTLAVDDCASDLIYSRFRLGGDGSGIPTAMSRFARSLWISDKPATAKAKLMIWGMAVASAPHSIALKAVQLRTLQRHRGFIREVLGSEALLATPY
jgi:glycosyltransferase involved in cell wall biosynthesis